MQKVEKIVKKLFPHFSDSESLWNSFVKQTL